MNTPFVSILMTAYNRERYIAEAIESVLSSTYTNFELIIVDDCSVDDTFLVARSYEQKDARIRAYLNDQNIGDYPNRNKAASYAKGKYLKYLDADDIMYPQCIELMVSAMEANPDAAYGFSLNYIQDNDRPFPIKYSSYEAYKQHFLVAPFFYAGPGGSIIKRAAFEAIDGFSGVRYIGDIQLWMRLSAKYPCIIFWPALIWWRQHDDQENKVEKLNMQNINVRHNMTIAILNADNCPLNDKEIRRAKASLERLHIRRIYKELIKLHFNTAYKLGKHAKLSFGSFFSAFLPVNKLRKLTMSYQQKNTLEKEN